MSNSNKKPVYSNKNDYICSHKIPSEPTTIILKNSIYQFCLVFSTVPSLIEKN